MPCILKVKVLAAKNLPVMDRKSELTDAFVEVRFADFDTQRTSIARKTLNPVWGEDFRYEVSDDVDLQDEPLEFRVLDYDTISANDTVGTILVDLNPLLTSAAPDQIAGWFPIYDSLCGIRGSLHVSVRLELFGDVNKFRDSSAGVRIFSVARIPAGMRLTAVLGLVDARLIEDDPEFHWSDNFRTPRSSNDSRQKLFFRLAGRLRRTVGRKALDMGADAVIGYQQRFDLENVERIISAGAIACAVRLEWEKPSPLLVRTSREIQTTGIDVHVFRDEEDKEKVMSTEKGKREAGEALSHFSSPPPAPSTLAPLPPPASMTSSSLQPMEVQSSISSSSSSSLPSVSIPPAPTMMPPSMSEPQAMAQRDHRSSPYGNSRGTTTGGGSIISAPISHRLGEQYLLPLRSLPVGTIIRLGGVVSVKAVKLIEDDEVRTREIWWDEVREEVRSHTRALGCVHVLGYTENMTVNEELCVLTASGTAVVLDEGWLSSIAGGERRKRSSPDPSEPPSPAEPVHEQGQWSADVTNTRRRKRRGQPHGELEHSEGRRPFRSRVSGCRMCHVPRSGRHHSSFPVSTHRCGLCHRRYVPEIILATMDPPAELDVVTDGHLVEARICRAKKHKEGDSHAAIVSEALPFVEYDIHRQLMLKLHILGMNAVFGLRFQLTIGHDLLMAVATGTAYYVSALPTPASLTISRNLDVVDEEDKGLLLTQERIMKLSEENRQKLEAAFQDRAARSKGPLPASFGNRRIPNTEGNDLGDTDTSTDEATDDDHDDGDTGIQGEVSEETSNPAPKFRRRRSSVDTTKGPENPRLYRGEEGHAMVVQVDDEADEDMVAILLEENFHGLRLTNVERTGGRTVQMAPTVFHKTIQTGEIRLLSHHPNRQFASVYRKLYDALGQSMAGTQCFVIAGVSSSVAITDGLIFQVRMTAVSMEEVRQEKEVSRAVDTVDGRPADPPGPVDREDILITPLSTLPYPVVTHYGRMVLHFVKEEHIQGGPDGDIREFTERFMSEVYRILEAHLQGLGANGFVGYVMEQMECEDNLKGTAYAVISISGDAVRVDR
ncbi:hypothetical protein BJ684DRAFT_18196 [Piptocephalis cylindrospora]|uniref:C2 domain-containing protein n=1 Tax=Piptocephalis cylindrospora TaxID=1907219 RepID=A0A4P9Y8Q2_9FUNG|nr:hypothetical protein BJ684DRAFT_18196 [Piptocephalis cylindrospora]|eukprot:RKP15493.1 hypothetical protein BJ684DRAFT_18196 [Piptocephalis cylindrospora]